MLCMHTQRMYQGIIVLNGMRLATEDRKGLISRYGRQMESVACHGEEQTLTEMPPGILGHTLILRSIQWYTNNQASITWALQAHISPPALFFSSGCQFCRQLRCMLPESLSQGFIVQNGIRRTIEDRKSLISRCWRQMESAICYESETNTDGDAS